MTAADIRDLNFDQLRASLEFGLRDVYLAFVQHGPGTTRQLATVSGIDLLTLRPRAHDLCQLGLLRLSGSTKARGVSEGIYEAVPPDAWRAWRTQQLSSTGAQLQFGALTT